MRRPTRLLAGAAALAAVLLALASCGGGSKGRRQEPPYQIGGRACLRALEARGVRVEPWSPPRAGGSSCRVDTPVRAVAGSGVRFTPALETSCAMLVAWLDLEAEVRGAARTHLGQPIRSVYHYGSHGCRAMSGNRGRISLHATARALDVSGFELANGRVLDVRAGWDGGTRGERRFLRAVRDAACRRLGVVLDPDSDRQHRDHIHMDLGGWRMCGR